MSLLHQRNAFYWCIKDIIQVRSCFLEENTKNRIISPSAICFGLAETETTSTD